MANQALWEVLDNIHISSSDLYESDFIAMVEAAMGDEYEVEYWDHDDYAACEIAESTIGWINDQAKHKVLEDLQVGTWWTEEEDACYTVVALKTKEIK